MTICRLCDKKVGTTKIVENEKTTYSKRPYMVVYNQHESTEQKPKKITICLDCLEGLQLNQFGRRGN